jgi:hypothetical protein
MENKSKLVNGFIITTFVSLYLMVSVISTIHVIDFFKLSNPDWLAISLAIAFEVGAAASLASLIALKKMNKGLVWMLFFLLTAMQAMGNTYYAYVNLEDFQAWIELFGLVDEELIFQKRILSIVSGAILPIVALGFIKSLVDYIKPDDELAEKIEEEQNQESENKEQQQTEDISGASVDENKPIEISKNLDGGDSIQGENTPVEDETDISEPLETSFNPETEMITDGGGLLERIDEENSLTEEEANFVVNSAEEETQETSVQEESLEHNGSVVKIQEKIKIKTPKHSIVEIPSSDPTRM